MIHVFMQLEGLIAVLDAIVSSREDDKELLEEVYLSKFRVCKKTTFFDSTLTILITTTGIQR